MANDPPPSISIAISLKEIYESLCPDCRARLIDYVSSKGGAGMLRDAIRKQLEAPCHSERSEESPPAPS